jgi:hypothetical protein
VRARTTGGPDHPSCIDCEPGQSTGDQPQQPSCSDCQPGKASPGAQGNCDICQAGQYTPGGHDYPSCIDCEPGQSTGDQPQQPSCSDCAAGQYSASVAPSCTDCEPGKSSTKGEGKDDCAICQAGQYTPGGPDHPSCIDCEPGQSTGDQPQQPSCSDCQPGKASPGAQGNCDICQAGQYTPGGHDYPSCIDCDPGQSTDDKRQQPSCSNCQPGKASPGAQGNCDICQAGQYTPGGLDYPSCIDCDPGQSTDDKRQQPSCSDCQPGKASPGAQGNCDICQAGQYSKANASECLDCPQGKFSDHDQKRNECYKCPGNSTTRDYNEKLIAGSDTSTDCHCDAGSNGTVPKSFRDFTSSPCFACPIGQHKAGTVPGEPCIDCALATYQDKEGQAQCKSCENLDGCHCGNWSNTWFTDYPYGGICRSGHACQSATTTCNMDMGARCTPSNEHNGLAPGDHRCDCHNDEVFGQFCEFSCAHFKNQFVGNNTAYCLHGGVCEYEPYDVRESGYRCNCKAGWSGEFCEIEDPCVVRRPCQNSAVCNTTTQPRPQGYEGYECTCPQGFTGLLCDKIDTAWGHDRPWAGVMITAILSVVCYFTIYGCSLHVLVVQSRAMDQSVFVLCRTKEFWRTLLPVVVAIVAMVITFLITAGAHTGATDCGNAGNHTVNANESCVNADASLYWITLLITMVEAILAGLFYQLVCRYFPKPGEGSRLLRGATVPLLAFALATPAILTGIMKNPNAHSAVVPWVSWANDTDYHQTHRTSDKAVHIDTVADIFILYGWWPLTFGVLFSCLPISVALARIYLREEYEYIGSNCEEFLRECGVSRPKLFLWSERRLGVLSGLMFPFFWNGFLVNEMQEFLSRHKGNDDQASVDGVRALAPVVCALNIFAAGWGFFMILQFPEPLAWTPAMLFGVVWCAVIAVLLPVLTSSLILSLSENNDANKERSLEKYWVWERIPEDAGVTGCCAGVRVPIRMLRRGIAKFSTSWTGQTYISGFNHLAALVFFIYGLYEFDKELTSEVKKFLRAGIVLTFIGLITSFFSLVQRRRWIPKFLPTDDSFRVACVLKALLVMTKALLVYELAKIDNSDPSFERWVKWVTIVCVFSILILGLLTYAFGAKEIYKDSGSGGDGDIEWNQGLGSGKRFILMYSLSFACCKLVTVFFVLLGHIPQFVDCDSEEHHFKGRSDLHESIDCVVCYAANSENNTRCDAKETSIYYDCATTCTKVFFSGGGIMPVELDVFVLVPLLWLPFVVYSNNEVARMIEGVRQERDTGVSSQSISGDTKLGLSSTAHGYTGITPLAHAIYLLCCCALGLFLFKSSRELPSGEHGYYVPLEKVLGLTESSELVQKWQEPIRKAGQTVTVICILLNSGMMVRFLFEMLCKGKANPDRQDSSRRLGRRNQMQAYSVGGQHEPLDQPIMKGQARNYGFETTALIMGW